MPSDVSGDLSHLQTDFMTMGIREKLSTNKHLGTAAGVGLFVLAALIVAGTFWPVKQADLNRAYYSDDDGKTWFADSAYRVAPFDHNGKTAVVAHVYSYADGAKEFCAYLAQFTPEAKAKLEAAIAEAQKQGKPPGSVSLYADQTFMKSGVVVKKPGDTTWLAYTDPMANAVFTIKAPDGSVVDQRFAE
jgi:hypothetical protein